jgi:ParB-like chromosome segregation protein Spo0J
VSIPFNTTQFEKNPNRKIPVRTVRVDKIDATQMKLDHAKVMSIAQRGADDGTLPIVHKFQGRYKVGDGHHRIGAAIEQGKTKMKVRVSE